MIRRNTFERVTFLSFLFATPSQDVFLLLLATWIGQGGSLLLVMFQYDLCCGLTILSLTEGVSTDRLLLATSWILKTSYMTLWTCGQWITMRRRDCSYLGTHTYRAFYEMYANLGLKNNFGLIGFKLATYLLIDWVADPMAVKSIVIFVRKCL